MKFYEVTLEKNSNDNTFQVSPEEGELWADIDDLLSEIRSNEGEVLELGEDELPKGIFDIRGLIHSQPERVFVFIPEQSKGEDLPNYFGINSIE